MKPRALYHFTCDRGRAGIAASGLMVWPRKRLGTKPLAWFTDLAAPSREALGLTSTVLSCDRMRYRFRLVRGPKLVPWSEYLQTATAEDRELAEMLAMAPGAQPEHWFVSPTPVKVVGPKAMRGHR